MMKIGLVGFGKTGKAVASVILQHKTMSLEWVLRKSAQKEDSNIPEFLGLSATDPGLVFSSTNTEIDGLLDQHPVDIIIDFSADSSIYYYGRAVSKRKIKIISAISHYKEEELDFLHLLAKETTVFWSPNITIGVNYLLFAAKFLKKIAPLVDIEIIEEHFKEKDSVSGTAMKIAEELDVQQSNINSIRVGGIVGKHEVIFGFPYQTVRLVHESISRDAFGNGVVFVAENLIHKKEGFFNFEDILLPYFAN